MRPFERFSLLFWFLILGVIAAHVGYIFHFFESEPVWKFIHLAGHPAGWSGMVLMILCLLYIPRKKKWFTWGKVRTWYRIHVVLGMAGPLMITLHAYGKYYGIGGLALACMWLTLLSGFIGFYLYRKLPDELKARVEDREQLVNRLNKMEKRIQEQAMEVGRIRQSIEDRGLLKEVLDSPRGKLPASTLAKSPANFWPLVRSFQENSRRLKIMKSRINRLARSEMEAAEVREREFLELVRQETDTRNLIVLNDFFAIWRKFHVPVSWLMWWLAALHLGAWMYY